MNLIGFNPAAPFEAVANGRLERESAVTIMGTLFSAQVSFLAGLSKVPIVGTAFLWAAEAMKKNLMNSPLLLKDKMRFTYPTMLDSPDLEKQFQASWREKP